MNFKEFFNQRVINELSEENFDRIDTDVKRLLEHKKLPFNHIFGDKLRIAERMNKVSDYQAKIKAQIVDNFELDFEKWVGYKLTDKDKKNPFRIGKLLNKRKQEIKKVVDMYLAKENPTQTEQIELNVWQNSLKEIDELLKVPDLQKLYKDSQQSNYYIVYSRSPVDVARMSDHTWNSCHSQKGEYFHCALADASLNAGIAYLINAEDFYQIELHLQEDEIFKDKERHVNGIVPIARYRIRCVIDSKGNTLAVPSLKLYGKNAGEMGPDFANQVITWAKQQDIADFDFDHTLTLKGGTYEDRGYDIISMVKRIWGKDIDYDKDTEIEQEFRDQDEDEDDHVEERWRDEQRENFDPENIYRDAFGKHYENMFDVGYEINGGQLALEYKIPYVVCEKIKKETKDFDLLKSHDIEFAHPKKPDVPYNASIDFLTETVKFDLSDRSDYVDFYDYTEWYGDGDGRFNESGLISDASEVLQKFITSFIGEGYDDDDEGMFDLRQSMNKKIYSIFNIDYEVLEWDDITDFYSRFVAGHSTGDKRNFGQFEVPHFEYEYEKRGYVKEVSIPDNVFDILYEVSNDIEDRLGLYISSKFGLPTSGRRVDIWNFFHSYFTVPEEFRGEDHIKQGNRQLIFRSSKSKRLYNLDIWLPESDAENILDAGELPKFYEALKYLDDEFADEVDKKKLGFFELNDFLKPLAKSREYQELKDQGQMELDLSQVNGLFVNKNMSYFNETIEKILQEEKTRTDALIFELNQGKGGMANQSGTTAPNASNPAQMQNNPNVAATPSTNPATTPATTTPQTQGQPNVTPNQNPQNNTGNSGADETKEFNDLLTMQQKNPQMFNQQAQVLARDPGKFSRFIQHLSQPMNG